MCLQFKYYYRHTLLIKNLVQKLITEHEIIIYKLLLICVYFPTDYKK